MKVQLTMLGLVCFGLASCIKHVVVPAPKVKVNLASSFSADTNGVTISYTDAADGYAVVVDNYREIKGSPQLSSIKYYNTLKSESKIAQVKFTVGSAEWDAASGNFPPLATVTAFLSTTVPPVYSAAGTHGVEIIWKDDTGVLWMTRDTSIATVPGTFAFTSVTQESDETGDYFKFKTTFTCYLYNNSGTDSVYFQNGLYTSYFKNN